MPFLVIQKKFCFSLGLDEVWGRCNSDVAKTNFSRPRPRPGSKDRDQDLKFPVSRRTRDQDRGLETKFLWDRDQLFKTKTRGPKTKT
jgi:hypothetical protein